MKQQTVILFVVALIAVLLCTVNAQQDDPSINPSTYSYQCRVTDSTLEEPTVNFVDCSTIFTTCPPTAPQEGITIDVLCVDSSNNNTISENPETDCIDMVIPTQDCTYEYVCAPQQYNNTANYTTCTDDINTFTSKLVVEEREIVNEEDPTSNTFKNVTTIQLTRSVVCISKGMYTSEQFSEDVNCVNAQPDVVKPAEKLTADVNEQEPTFVRQCQLFNQTGVVEACPANFTAAADQLKFCSGLKNEVFTQQNCTQTFAATFFTDKIVEITQACPINTNLICHKYAMSCSNKFKGNTTSDDGDDETEPEKEEEEEQESQEPQTPVVQFRVTNTTNEEEPSQGGQEEPSQGGQEEPSQGGADDEKEQEDDEEEEPSFPSGEIPAQQCVLQLPICPSCTTDDILFITDFTATTVQYDTINCYRYNATGHMELIVEPTADEYALCMRASNITIDPKTIINDNCDILDTCSYYQCSITQPTPAPTPTPTPRS
eukprot:UN01695